MVADKPEKQNPNAQAEKRVARQEKKDGPSGDALALAYTIKNELAANRSEQRSQERWKSRREWATLVFVVITAVGIFVQAYILHNSDKAFHVSAKAAKDAAEIADTSLKATQRAFIIVTGFDEPIHIPNLSTPNSTKFRLAAKFENAGATATESLTIVAITPFSFSQVQSDEIQKDLGGSLTTVEYRRYMNYRDMQTGSPPDPDNIAGADATLGPKQKIPLPGSESFEYEISVSDGDAAQMEEAGRFFYGQAKYTDVFKKAHVTKYCFRIDGFTKGDLAGPPRPMLRLCGHWNCVDDQCAEDRRKYDAEVKAVTPRQPPR